MGNARRLWKAFAVLSLLAVSLVVLLPALTGHPVVSYASSGSMEPTIGVFDAFLVVPWPRDVDVGDIVVFDSVSQGGLAVHRIVGGDENGWVTQGDANPAPDQRGSEPLLTRDRILGKVVVGSDGAPILFDDAGVAFVEARIEATRAANVVGGPRQAMALGFLALAAVLAVPAFSRRRPDPPARLPLRAQRILRRAFPRGILGRHLALLLLVATLASVGWAATQARSELDLSLVVVEDPTAADDTRAAAPGGALARDIRVGSLGIVPTTILLEPGTELVRIDDPIHTVGPMATTVVRVHEVGGPTTGVQEDSVHVWRYPTLLPPSATAKLHAMMPGSPYVLLAAAMTLAGWTWYAALRIARMPVGRMLGLREGWL